MARHQPSIRFSLTQLAQNKEEFMWLGTNSMWMIFSMTRNLIGLCVLAVVFASLVYNN